MTARGLLKSQKLNVGVHICGKTIYLPIRRNDFLAATAGISDLSEIPAVMRSEHVTIETEAKIRDNDGRIQSILFEGL